MSNDKFSEIRIKAQNGGYLYKEALCLMKYATKDGAEVEWIWNSRDGVTPFGVRSRSGVEMFHVQWQNDIRRPNYEPLPGERLFVDITPGYAELLATRNIDQYWDHDEYPMREAFADKEEAVKRIAADYLGDGDRPTLVEAAEWQPARTQPTASAGPEDD